MSDPMKQKIEEIDKFSLAEKISLFLLIVTERSDGNLHKDEWKFVENNIVIQDSKTSNLLKHPSLLHIIDLTSKTTAITNEEVKQHGKQILETLLNQSQFNKFKKWHGQNWDVYFEEHGINFMEFFGAEIIPYYESLFSSLNMTFKKWVYALLIQLLKVEDAGEENNQNKQGWAQGLPGDIGLGDVKIKFTGSKTVNYEGGASYSGDFVNDLYHGKGIYISAEGDKYEGDFVEDSRHGHGVYIWESSKNKYEGEWKNGVQHGSGIFIWDSGDRYEGDYFEGKRHGKGVLSWADGTKYEGDFKEGERTGNGIYYWEDGSYYEGSWTNGEHDTKGVYYDKKKKYSNIHSIYLESDELIKKVLLHSNLEFNFEFKLTLLKNLSDSSFLENTIKGLVDNQEEFTKKAIKKLSQDKGNYSSSRIRKTVAQNSLTSLEIIETLIDDEHRHVREAAASHPTIDKNKIEELSKSADRYLLSGLSANPNCPKSVKENIQNQLKDEEKHPRHFMDIAFNNEFYHLDEVNPNKFWANKLMEEAELLYNEFENKDGESEFDFEDWQEDCFDYGQEYYLYTNCPDYVPVKAAFFQVNVYLPNNEGTAINIIDFNEVVGTLLKYHDWDAETLFELHPWIADYKNEEDIQEK